ncbi:outer membrane beta-barrel protein [Thalassomonas viridans]|uniref:Outer membrane beta-barrel protein n=1 Tax=Thalassomonas viridans TaxID=137584 RepID=A0AAE9Z5Z2_9GAMM|nr:outer membrane beta-barrel protein [Thalassomonas viridans]WDE06714.1 outer membrane beta-barrel protein [Thalassomonas viridans]
MKKSIPLLLLLSSAFPCFADSNRIGSSWTDFRLGDSSFVGVDYMFSGVKVSGEDPKPKLAGLKAGISIYEQISLEANYLQGTSTGDVAGLEFDVEDSKGLYLLFKSGNDTSFGVDITLGYASTKLTVTGEESSFNSSEEYNGFSWGISFYDSFPSFENLQMKIGYKSLYDDENIKIDGFTLGFNYYF